MPELPYHCLEQLEGMRLRRSMVCVSLMNRLAFAAGRHTVRLMPQNLKPITSLVVSKFPSPFFNLLSEIGSFPFACLVVAVSGKTEWMPWIDARLIFGTYVSSVD